MATNEIRRGFCRIVVVTTITLHQSIAIVQVTGCHTSWEIIPIIVTTPSVVVGTCLAKVDWRTIQSEGDWLRQIMFIKKTNRRIVIVVVVTLTGMATTLIQFASYDSIVLGGVVAKYGETWVDVHSEK